MFGLLGPNGAGKTTFLSILVLALEPTRRAGGSTTASTRPRGGAGRRSGGGSASFPRTTSPIGHLTGREYLAHCARLREVPLGRAALRRRIAELIEGVGLERAADRRAGEYSGGMKRRLGIAQALIHSPALLVVDEPTAGLDPEERIRFRMLVTAVSADTTVLLSTHIVEDVEATCPRLAVIGRGRLLFDGSPTELLRRADGRLWQMPAGDPAAGGGPGGHPPHRSPGGIERVVHHDGPIPGAVRRPPNLEESYAAFLALQGIEALPDGPEGRALSATAAFVAHEVRTQLRSLRFRVLAALYVAAGSAPAVLL